MLPLGYLDAHLPLGLDPGQISQGKNSMVPLEHCGVRGRGGKEAQKKQNSLRSTDLGTRNHPHKPKKVHITLLHHLKLSDPLEINAE